MTAEAASEVRLVVKHTFLEFVEEDAGPSTARPWLSARRRSLTDSALAFGNRGLRQHPLAVDMEYQEVLMEPPQQSSSSQSSSSSTAQNGAHVNQDATTEVKAVLGMLPPSAGGRAVPERLERVPSPGQRGSRQLVNGVQSPTLRKGRKEAPRNFEAAEPAEAQAARAKPARSARAPKAGSPAEPEPSPGLSEGEYTTVLFRNLPRCFTRDMFLELVDSEGFAGAYNFVYTPVDFSSQAGLGYAFINFTSPAMARLFWGHFDGYSKWSVPNEKAGALNWSCPSQGLAAHLERYRNSPVMHSTVPDEWKPAVFLNGVRVAFPAPTKVLKAPKIRHAIEASPPAGSP